MGQQNFIKKIHRMQVWVTRKLMLLKKIMNNNYLIHCEGMSPLTGRP